MVYVVCFLIMVFVCIVVYIYNPLRRPLPTESDYSHHKSPWWELYYCSKYLKTIKKAERGSGLESNFKNSKLPNNTQPSLSQCEVITIKTVGDLMYRRDLVPPASRHLWDEVGTYVFDADFAMGNLEFAVNPSWVIEKTIRYSIPPANAEPLLGDARFGRFDLVATANNHINDSLSQGIISTCDHLDKTGILYVGANRTEEEVDNFPIVERKGIKIAVLSYTFSTNGIPLDKGFDHGTNLVRFNAIHDKDYDPSLIYRHIDLARNRGADLIIASMHWGIEFEYYPPSRLVKRAHDLLDAGVDIIIGHHPHTLNPAEWYITRDGRRTLCLYSLGNITSYALIRPLQKMSIIAEIAVEAGIDEHDNKVVRLKDATLMPTYFYMKGRGRKAEHRIIPVMSCAKDIREGKRPQYMSNLDAMIIKMIDKDFRKYIWQEKAFKYK